jgi:type I restriction enzyme, S subunit
MSEPPNGWTVAPIGDLCSLNNGRAFKPTEWSDSGLPIVRIQNLNDPKAKFNYFPGEFGHRYHLKGGELLFAWSGTPGTSFGAHIWRGKEALLNQHIFRVDFDEKVVEKRFFRYAINQKLNELIGKAHGGVGLRHVTKGKFEQTEIAVPPRSEQMRIAGSLESLLAKADYCRERLDRLPQILRKFREAILEAAVSGKLTEEWRTRNGTQLEAWSTSSVGQLVTKIEAGLNVQCEERPPEPEEKGLVKISAVTWGEFDEEQSKTLPRGSEVSEAVRILAGDFLISRANTLEFVGACVLVKSVSRRLYLSDKVLRLRTEDQLKPWLLISLRSRSGRKQIETLASGNQLSMRNLSQANLRSISVTVPPPEERAEAVRRVDELFALADSLQRRYSDTTRRVEKLTPSILAKAFRGELVPQDPNDEPADEMLERVRAARSTDGEFTTRIGAVGGRRR